MELGDLKANWEAFGRTIPMRSILWRQEPWEPEDFFASGRQQVDGSMADLAALGIRPRGRALDFGCGVGRLSQGLARHFGDVVGVDIASSMVDQARAYNREFNPHPERCRFFVNTTADLSQFGDGTFDFVYSLIVLQHVGAEPAKRYIREFMRLLQPGGYALFQMTSDLLPVPELPAQGRRAALSLEGGAAAPLDAVAGASLEFATRVHNLSALGWEPAHRVTLNGVWLRAGSGEPVDDQGPWAPLDHPLGPSQDVVVPVVAGVPGAAGDYVLRLELHQARLGPFAPDVCGPLAVPVHVGGGAGEVAGAAPADVEAVPHMDMHGVPRDEVVAIVEAGGGRVVDVADDPLAGRDWRSFVYVAHRLTPASEPRRLRGLTRGRLRPR